MENPFLRMQPDAGSKRYYTLDAHLKKKFGGKVCKIMLDAGFTCPNIDGTKGYGGCTYCSSAGSGDFAGKGENLLEQFEQVRKRMDIKWPHAKYIAYFQAHTNTYAPLEILKQKYKQVLYLPDVVGLDIATRADCINEEIADYLQQLSRETYLTVELGLQSVFDSTGERINRCHSYRDFLQGYAMLRQRGISVCVHLINGLPGEDREMMLHSAKTVAALRPQGIKLHLLYVLRNTPIARQLEQQQFHLLSLEEYVDIVCHQLEFFSADTVIHRLTGDGKKEDLIGPLWSLKKFCVLNEIDKRLIKMDSFQGKKWTPNLYEETIS